MSKEESPKKTKLEGEIDYEKTEDKKYSLSKEDREYFIAKQKEMNNFFTSVFMFGMNEKTFDEKFNETIKFEEDLENTIKIIENCMKLLSHDKNEDDISRLEKSLELCKSNLKENKRSMSFHIIKKNLFYKYKANEDMLSFVLDGRNNISHNHVSVLKNAFIDAEGVDDYNKKMQTSIL